MKKGKKGRLLKNDDSDFEDYSKMAYNNDVYFVSKNYHTKFDNSSKNCFKKQFWIARFLNKSYLLWKNLKKNCLKN